MGTFQFNFGVFTSILVYWRMWRRSPVIVPLHCKKKKKRHKNIKRLLHSLYAFSSIFTLQLWDKYLDLCRFTLHVVIVNAKIWISADLVILSFHIQSAGVEPKQYMPLFKDLHYWSKKSCFIKHKANLKLNVVNIVDRRGIEQARRLKWREKQEDSFTNLFWRRSCR